MQLLSVLIIILPLFSSLINGLFCYSINRKISSIVSCSLMIFAFICSCIIFINMLDNEDIYNTALFSWIKFDILHINFAVYLDKLTSIMFFVVTLVSSIVHIYSIGYMHDDENLPKFLSFLSLFTFFMLSLVSSDNFLQLFFGWEGVGLCSYLLIGYWYEKDSANAASIKAFITNRVSDFAFILGIISIFYYTKHLDFNHVFAYAKDLSMLQLNIQYGIINSVLGGYSVLDIISFLLFIGCMGKSAQIGFHIWLPDAMEGPTPVSALIHAATMVTAGVFLLARCSYLFEYSKIILQFIVYTGSITCIVAAVFAVVQTDIKKIIAYSTCSQLGYMFIACGLSCYNLAIFHLVTHAMFKALLFLCAGNVIHACHDQNIYNMGGLKAKMPITYMYFTIASLAIVGIFPFAGYYSKDAILESAYIITGTNTISIIIFIIGIISVALTALYSTKIIILVFYGKTRLSNEVYDKTHEVDKIMNIPLAVLAFGSIFAGFIGYNTLKIQDIGNYSYFGNSIYQINNILDIHHVTFFVQNIPLLMSIIGISIGLILYSLLFNNKNYHFQMLSALKEKLQKPLLIISIFNKAVYNKFYFDEIYNVLFIKSISNTSRFTRCFDEKGIDKFGVMLISLIPFGIGKLSNKLQAGNIANYIITMFIGIAIYITIFIYKY